MNAYDVLEEHSDNNFCRLILNFMVNNPLEKYSQVRLLDIETALKELNEIAKQLTNLSKLLRHLESQNDTQFEFANVLTMFMIHISCIFARNMVEILICLSFHIEPHISFWEKQYKLNGRHNKYKLYKNLTKIYTLTISLRRARIFKKLLSDLYAQMGRIQCWFWGLIKLKANNTDIDAQNNNTYLMKFYTEMNELFNNSENNKSDHSQNSIDLMIETISFADSFVIKMQKDIQIWGMPSHWRQNYKIYSFFTVSVMFTSVASYYNWAQIKYITHNSFEIMKKLCLKYFYAPIDDIFRQIFYTNNSDNTDLNNEYKMEKRTLTEMVTQFETQNGESNMVKYKSDIQRPIAAAMKGSLLANMFIQMQKMKVEMSKVLLDVNHIMYSNRINMQLFATIPLIGLLYMGKGSGNQSNKKVKKSMNDLRFIFRSMYAILIKNYSQNRNSDEYNEYNEHMPYEQCGLMLFLAYKCYFWGQTNMKNKGVLSMEEFQWLKFDINHFISKEFSVEQRLSMLKRIETYYL